MIEPSQIIYIEPAESAKYVSYEARSAAMYVNYTTRTSVEPASLDQIIKNNVIVVTNAPAISYGESSALPSSDF